ncbi:probable ubiquitin-like-specific protease 2B isoform X6 [Sesamum indicum]|nr:probable ubiquitin-like-specific protease 2B isoform X6 [Sesamum indicum]XP_020548058.1 probable ubiquitin-like-specific protease 2B isoform X6 [Sesamum indicum]
MLKNYYHIHPIWKSIQVAEEEKCHNLESSLSQVPRGQRSKGRGTEKVTAAQDAGSNDISIMAVSRSQLDFAAHPRKPRNVRTKRAAEPSDSEVTCERSLRSCRQLRRLKCSTTVVQKWGKLDSEKFEVYMESVWRRFTEERKNIFTYLDSLWFSLYAKEPLKTKVLSWIKRKDIFSKTYVFVPIVQWGHWFLLIFCHFGESPQSTTKRRCMLLLDSLQKANSKQLEPEIRRFVFDIFKIEARPEKKELISKIPLLIPKVPQQKYGEECGLFVLYYINLFLEMAPDNFSFSMGYPHFMKEDWFTHEEVESFAKGLDSMNETSAHSD